MPTVTAKHTRRQFFNLWLTLLLIWLVANNSLAIDVVVVGEGESVWLDVLADAEAGRLKPRYQSDDRFDLVTAVETHYFWPDLPRDLVEVRRVLKPGGMLALVPATAEAEDGAATTDVVDGRDHLGHQRGVAEGVGADHQAELDALARQFGIDLTSVNYNNEILNDEKLRAHIRAMNEEDQKLYERVCTTYRKQPVHG